MGFLFLIITGILAMVFIAKLASKTKLKGEEVAAPTRRDDGHSGYFSDSKSQKVDLAMQKGLISLLLKKKVIGEEELLAEINRIKNDPSLN